MAITTLDGVLAGMQPPESFFKVVAAAEEAGIFHSLFYTKGRPGAAVAPTPGLAGAALTSYAGQIPYTNPSSGNAYLSRLFGSAGSAGQLLLCDRLWHNSGFTITTTTAQTVTSAAWPARAQDGTTDGLGVLVGLEVSTGTGNGSSIANTTLQYTNQSGSSGKTGTMPYFPATALAGTFVPFVLAGGDRGVRSIQSLTLGTSYVSGTIHLVAYRVLARLPLAHTGGAELDAVTGGFPRLYDDTVPFLLWLPSGTGTVTIHGQLVVTHG